ncbi:MAG: hypothetical protein V4695_00050 [Pseudomonadota bacterium]
MKTSAASKGNYIASPQFRTASLAGQRGMGATIVLFTIALIVLVGAALALASRGNPSAINTQGGKVYSGVLLKQSADYRDGYSRFIFDGGNPATMTFNTALNANTDLFNPTLQLAVYQAPPAQATPLAADNVWRYNGAVTLDGVGTAAGTESITYVSGITREVCAQANFQMYGTTDVPVSTVADAAAAAVANVNFPATAPATPGRANGCMELADGSFLFFSTLGEG